MYCFIANNYVDFKAIFFFMNYINYHSFVKRKENLHFPNAL